jgi:hypothetical protein
LNVPESRRGRFIWFGSPCTWRTSAAVSAPPTVTPGISDSVHHIYLADGADRIGPPEDDFESDRVSWVPLADIPALIGQGKISTGTTLAALLYALTREPPGN